MKGERLDKNTLKNRPVKAATVKNGSYGYSY